MGIRNRRAGIGGLVMAAILAPAGSAPAGQDPPAPPPVPLRIVTLNVKEGIGVPGQTAYEGTADFLTTIDEDGAGPNSGLNPDIVCLQECKFSAPSELLNFVSARLPGYQVWPQSPPSQPGDPFNYNAIVLRPDIVVLDDDYPGAGGPRRNVRLTVEVPGALDTLTIYCAHFKSGSSASDQNIRRNEAITSGIALYTDLTEGLDLDDDGLRETPAGDLVFFGDLNSDDNGDGTLDGLFTHATLFVPTGVLDLAIESLAGRNDPNPPQAIWTFFSGSFLSRLDYGCLDESLAAYFDADQNGVFSQDELNSMGFVYWSQHDNGKQANGNASATTQASDHRPVVFDLMLPRDPSTWFDPRDINHDQKINSEDLQLWETLFSQGTAPDVNGDAAVTLADRDDIRAFIRQGEPADVAHAG